MTSKRFINGNTVFWLYIALCVVDSNTLCKLENTYLAHYSRIYFPKAESRFRLRLLSIRRVPDMAPVEPRNYYKQPTDPCLWPYIHSNLWMLSYSKTHLRLFGHKDPHRVWSNFHLWSPYSNISSEFIFWIPKPISFKYFLWIPCWIPPLKSRWLLHLFLSSEYFLRKSPSSSVLEKCFSENLLWIFIEKPLNFESESSLESHSSLWSRIRLPPLNASSKFFLGSVILAFVSKHLLFMW